MKPLKILHLDFDDLESPTGGGQAVRTFEINRRLIKKGHQVTVVTMSYAGAVKKIKEGIHYERSGINHYPFNFISYFLSVPFILWSHQFDLVVEDNMPPTSFGLSPLYTKKPVISQVQSLLAEGSSKKHKLPFWFFEQRWAKRYKNFIVLTEELKKKIHSLNKKSNTEVIPNGLSRVYPLTKDHKKQLLFLGRIDYYYKGIEHLLNIAKIFLHTLPDYKIIIAGDGRDRSKLEEQIKTMNLTNVEYVGLVKGEKKEELIKNSALLLLTSRFETFPFTILEAAAHGKPTVFFDIPNLHELQEKNVGVAVPQNNEAGFADAVVKTVRNENRLNTLGFNAHEWAKNHLWDTIVDQQEKFYESIAAPHSNAN